MGTVLRPELSEKNKYWINRHRYYELRHFCLQYPIWRKAYAALDGLSRRPSDLLVIEKSGVSDPTARCAVSKAFFSDRMEMVEGAAKECDPELGRYILAGVTEGLSYDRLHAKHGVPCCKEVYYALYRRFFWLLNRARN